MRLLEALADRVERADGEMRAAVDELRPELGRPADGEALDDAKRGARIIRAAERLGKAEQIARMDDADDDLLTIGGHLRDLEPSVDEKKEMRRRRALLEEGFAGADAFRDGLRQQRLDVAIRHLFEHRKGFYDALVDLQRSLLCHIAT